MKQPSLSGSVFKLATGRMAATVISIATAPVVARLYDPDCFGILTLAMAVTLFFYPAGRGFGYGLAMPLATSRAERRAVFVLAAVLGVAICLVLAVGTLLLREPVANYLGYPDFAKYAVILPILCLATTIRALVDLLLNCERQFGRVAFRGITETLVLRMTQIGFGFTVLGNTAAGLLASLIAAVYAAALTFSVKPVRAVLRADREPFQLTELKAVAVRYRSFPLFRFWSEMLTIANYSVPVLLLGSMFSVTAVGYYGLGRPLLYLPVVLFARAGRDVFYIEASQATVNGHSAAPMAIQLLRLLSTLVAFPFTVVLIFGPFLFEVVFGSQWREAGVYAQLLTPGIVLIAIGQPISAIFEARNKMGEGFLLNVVLLVVTCATMVLGSVLCDPSSNTAPRVALACLSGGRVLAWTWVVSRAVRIAQARRREAVAILVRPYFDAALLLLPAGLVYWVGGWPLPTIVALTLASVLHLVVLHYKYPQIVSRIKDLLGRRRSSKETKAANGS